MEKTWGTFRIFLIISLFCSGARAREEAFEQVDRGGVNFFTESRGREVSSEDRGSVGRGTFPL